MNVMTRRQTVAQPTSCLPEKWCVLLLTGAVLAGCEAVPTRFASGLSAEDRALALALPVHRDSLAEGSYRSVGSVTGVSCQITHDDPYRISERNALEELRLAAFQAGGSAVMEVKCNSVERGQGARRCFRSIECAGIAVETGKAN